MEVLSYILGLPIRELLTTFVKLAFKMQFKQRGEAIELLFAAKPLLVSAQ